MPNWTAEDFKRNLGMEPEADDLTRINCNLSGCIGHTQCGQCKHNYPKFWVCKECNVEKYGGQRDTLAKPAMRMRVVESTRILGKLSLCSQ